MVFDSPNAFDSEHQKRLTSEERKDVNRLLFTMIALIMQPVQAVAATNSMRSSTD